MTLFHLTYRFRRGVAANPLDSWTKRVIEENNLSIQTTFQEEDCSARGMLVERVSHQNKKKIIFWKLYTSFSKLALYIPRIWSFFLKINFSFHWRRLYLISALAPISCALLACCCCIHFSLLLSAQQQKKNCFLEKKSKTPKRILSFSGNPKK